jgi:hypothetical protein
MAESTLEERVAVLEKAMAELKPAINHPDRGGGKGLGLLFNNDPVFEEMVAYRKYFRKSGQLPPDDWNPGDPIPEPSEESVY